MVTGGARGLGLETARRLISDGMTVVITDLGENEVKAAAADLGPSALGVQADVTSGRDMTELYRLVQDRFGRLDVVVANAGAGFHAPIGSITEEDFDRTFDVNVKGVVLTVQGALSLMAGSGSIVIIGSIGSVTPPKGTSMYSGAKAAVRTFARAWIQEPAAHGVRINVVSPGSVDTESLRLALTLAQGAEQADRTITQMALDAPIGRLVAPREVADTVAFLASEAASAITGSELFVDGGQAQI